MEQKNCLNCGMELVGKFCYHCGQRAATHRITFWHFITHDILHGAWHMDRGILFTLKELFTRPGHAAMDYIEGKRVRYYNVFYLLLIFAALSAILNLYLANFNNISKGEINSFDTTLKFTLTYAKFFALAFVPVIAFNAWLLFRKMKFNYAEHNIIAGFVMLGWVTISLCFNSVRAIFKWTNNEVSGDFHSFLLWFAFILYFIVPLWVYYSIATTKKYKIWGIIWRMGCFYFLLNIEILLFSGAIMHFLEKG